MVGHRALSHQYGGRSRYQFFRLCLAIRATIVFVNAWATSASSHHPFERIYWLIPCFTLIAAILATSQKKPLQAHVVAPMAAPAANWILKKQEVFDVLQAKPGWTQPGRGTLNTFQRNHQPYSPAFFATVVG